MGLRANIELPLTSKVDEADPLSVGIGAPLATFPVM